MFIYKKQELGCLTFAFLLQKVGTVFLNEQKQEFGGCTLLFVPRVWSPALCLLN